MTARFSFKRSRRAVIGAVKKMEIGRSCEGHRCFAVRIQVSTASPVDAVFPGYAQPGIGYPAGRGMVSSGVMWAEKPIVLGPELDTCRRKITREYRARRSSGWQKRWSF